MLSCPACGNTVFPRINPAVIVGVTDKNRLLLTKYRGRAYKNYALVAGFTEIGESFEETVAREVFEETGLSVKNIRYYKSQPWGFADDILAGYFCEVDGNTEITMDSGELSVAEWVERDDIHVTFDDTSLTNEMICAFKDGKQTEE
jgi:NAD+ diphosphatase